MAYIITAKELGTPTDGLDGVTSYYTSLQGMIDVEHFKRVNDEHGHRVGGELL